MRSKTGREISFCVFSKEAVVNDNRSFGGRAAAVAADLATADGPHKRAPQVRAIAGDRLLTIKVDWNTGAELTIRRNEERA